MLSRLRKIVIGFLVIVLLVTVIRIDVVHSESVKKRYGLVVVLIDEELQGDNELMAKVQRYSTDAQNALPNSKFLPMVVPSDTHPSDIQSVLERLYFEGDGQVNEYNKLIGVVIVGDVSLPVVQKYNELFPSIYPYVDFYRKQYIYDGRRDVFAYNDRVHDPVPEIWHGIITPPVDGDEGRELLKKYFDSNHEFYSGGSANVYDKKAFFADFYHEKQWVLPEALKGYEGKMDHMREEAFSYFTGKLAQDLRQEQEGRLREQGLDSVYDNIEGGGNIDPADRALLDSGARSALGGSQVANIDPDDVSIPDIHSIHVVRAFWKEFYQVAQKYVTEVNTFVSNSGRWNPEDVDTPVSLISKKDQASKQVLYNMSVLFEDVYDQVVEDIQSDITLIDSYSTEFLTPLSYVNGARVNTLSSAQDCSLYLGTFDPDQESQLVEASRVHNPLTAGDTGGFAGCHGRNVQNPGACNPDNATRPVKDLAGTQLHTQPVFPDYRECFERVTISSIPGNAQVVTLHTIPSVVQHKEPTGDTLSTQLQAAFSQYLPIDYDRYTTFQGSSGNPLRLDYLTTPLWSIASGDHDEIEVAVRDVLNIKNNEIVDLIVSENLESFKNYIGARMSDASNLDTLFDNWRTQTLTLLQNFYTGQGLNTPNEYFERYMLGYVQLENNQRSQLRTVFDGVFGNLVSAFDQQSFCGADGCGEGSYSIRSHQNFTSFHDFFAAGGDRVTNQTATYTAEDDPDGGPANLFAAIRDDNVQLFQVGRLIPRGYFSSLLDDDQLGQLVDALVWKNLSVEKKHQYVLDRYLGDLDPFVFDLDNGYEVAYLVADGDSTSIDLSINRGISSDDDSEFLAIQREREESLREIEPEAEEVPDRLAMRCPQGNPEGVDAWLWVPYVICWAQDALTPPFFEFADGSEEAPEIVRPPALDSDTLSEFISARLLELNDGESVADEIIVGGNRGVLEFEIHDSSGTILADENNLVLEVTFDDDSLFESYGDTELSFIDGRARFEFVSGEVAGVVRVGASAVDGSASMRNDFELLFGASDPETLNVKSVSSSVVPSSSVKFVAELLDGFGNKVSNKQYGLEVSVDGLGEIVGQRDLVHTSVFLNGESAFDFRAPEDVDGYLSSTLDLRLASDEFDVRASQAVDIYPEILIEMSSDGDVTQIAGSPIDIGIEVTDGDGNILDDFVGDIVFEVSPQGGGSVSAPVIITENGKGTIQFFPGLFAGDVSVRATHPGFVSDSVVIDIVSGDPASLEISSDKASMNILSSESVPVEVRLYDQGGNLVENDNGTSVTLRASSLTEGLVDIQGTGLSENGVATFVLTPLAGASGEVHLIAESTDLISGAMTLPLEARLGRDEIRGMDFQALYGSFLGAPLGDVTQDDYLGGWLLFDGKLQALSAVSRKLHDALPLVRVGQNSYFQVSDEALLDIEYDSDGQDSIGVYEDSELLVRLHPVLSSGASLHLRSVFDRKQTFDSGITVVSEDIDGFNFVARDDAIELMDSSGRKLVSIGSNFDIEISDGLFSLAYESTEDDRLMFTLLNGPSPIATVVFNVDFPVVEMLGQDSLSRDGLYVEIVNDALDVRDTYTSASTHGASGFEIVDSSRMIERGYGSVKDGVEDIFERPGLGWKGDSLSLLHFASGSSAGDASKHTVSDIEYLLGDPVVSLKLASSVESDGSTQLTFNESDTSGVGFDRSVGELLHRSSDAQVSDLQHFDYNNDGLEDVAMIMSDGSVELLRSIDGDVPLESLGTLVRFPEVPKMVLPGDFVRDQYDDLLGLLPDGRFLLQRNEQKKFIEQYIDLGIDNITSIASDDMDRDSFIDLIVSDARGDVHIFYGSSGGFVQPGTLLQELGVKIDPSSELNSQTLVFYPGVLLPQYGTSACDPSSNAPECQRDHFKHTSYVPDYVRDVSLARDDDGASDGFDTFSDENLDRSNDVSSENEELFSLFSDGLDEIENIGGSVVLADVTLTPFLKGSIDGNLSVQKSMRRVGGNSQSLDIDDTVRVTVRVENQSRSTIGSMAFADSLPGLFTLKPGSLSCFGCQNEEGEDVPPRASTDFEFLYDSLALAPSDSFEITYEVHVKNLPSLSLMTGYFDRDAGVRSSEDRYLDVLIKPEGNRGKTLLYLVSDGPRGYTFVRSVPEDISVPDEYSDIADRANLSQARLQQEAQSVLNDFVTDTDLDGIPDLFDIFSNQPVPQVQARSFQLIPQAFAQDQPGSQIDLTPITDGVTDALGGIGNALDGAASSLQGAMSSLLCKGGCVSLPVNASFLTPGLFNVFGVPGGFDPGLPAVWVSPNPFNPVGFFSQNPLSTFRFYVSPTLNLGAAMAFCVGPYLSSPCYTYPLPVTELTGGFCEELNASVQQVAAAPGALDFNMSRVADLGVVSFGGSTGDTVEVSNDAIGVEYGIEMDGDFDFNPTEEPKNKRLPSFPPFVSDWLDAQWEEIVNSFSDFPDLIVYYPDFPEIFGSRNAQNRKNLEKQFKKKDEIESWQGVTEALASIPIFDVKIEKIAIKYPWFEPTALEKFTADLELWTLQLLDEVVEFLDGFQDLSCGLLDPGQNLRELLVVNQPDGELASQIEAARKQAVSEGYSDDEALARRIDALVNESLLDDYRNPVLTDTGQVDHKLNAVKQMVQYKAYIMQDALKEDSYKQYLDDAGKDQADAERQKEVGQCVAAKFGFDVMLDVSATLSSIEQNFKILNDYKKLPRKLAQYYNLVGDYLGEVTGVVDGALSLFVGWIQENTNRMQSWIDAVYSFEEFVVLWENILNLTADYKANCSLCKSDRFTLKDFLMRFFVVLPDIPVVPFPNWPDLILDLSDVKIAVPLTIPALNLVPETVVLPRLPRVQLPSLKESSVSLGLDLGASVSLPAIPVLPAVPEFPDLSIDLPDLPTARLPVIPYPPKLPNVFDWILPVTDVLKGFFNVVCVLNQAVIPVDEMKLKTQVENLTARPLSPLLPIDLGLAVEAQPMNNLNVFPDFIKLSTSLEVRPAILDDIVDGLVNTIVRPWNSLNIGIVDAFNSAGSQASDALGGYVESAVETIESVTDSAADLDIEIDVSSDLSVQLMDHPFVDHEGIEAYKKDFADRLQAQRLGDVSDLLGRSPVVSHMNSFKDVVDEYRSSISVLEDEYSVADHLAEVALNPTESYRVASVLDGAVTSYVSEDTSLESDTRVVRKSMSLMSRDTLLAQAGGSPQAQVVQTPEVSLEGLYIMTGGTLQQLTTYTDASADQRGVLMYDFDDDGDTDVVYASGSSIYFKRSYLNNNDLTYYPSVPVLSHISDHLPARNAVDMFETLGERDKSVRVGWDVTQRGDELPYYFEVRDSIDGHEFDQSALRYLVIPSVEDEVAEVADTYDIVERRGDVMIRSLSSENDVVRRGDTIETGLDGFIRFDIGDAVITLHENSQFTVPDFSEGEIILHSGSMTIASDDISFLRYGSTLESGDGDISLALGSYSYRLGSQERVSLPALMESDLRFSLLEGNVLLTTRPRTVCSLTESCDGKRGDHVHALFDSVIVVDGVEVPLLQGIYFELSADASFEMKSGIVEVITQDESVEIEPFFGMRILPGDVFRLRSSIHLNYRGGDYTFEGTGELYILGADENRTGLSMTNGHRYARMGSFDSDGAFGTLGALEYMLPREDVSDPLVLTNPEEVELAIFSSRFISAADYIEGADESSVYFDLDVHTDSDRDGDTTNDRDSEGLNHMFGPYDTLGVHDVMINIVGGRGERYTKPLRVRVFVPQVTLSDTDFSSRDQIRGTIDPPIASYPVNVVRDRGGFIELLDIPADSGFEGPNEIGKYLTDSTGSFALEPFDILKGVRVLDNDSDEIMRILESNGRIILHPDVGDEYSVRVLPSSEDQPLRTVLLNANEDLVATVYFVPEFDNDVTIDNALTSYDTDGVTGLFGVHVKSMVSDLSFERIPGDSNFYPGGALLLDDDGERIAVVGPGGDLEYIRDGLSLRIRHFVFDDDPVVFELLDGRRVLAEVYVAGDFSDIQVVQPDDIQIGESLFDANGNGILDSWERAYGFTGSGEEIAVGDIDGDTLTNLEEYSAGTHPYLVDTDRDGVTDDIEVRGESDAILEAADEHRFNDVLTDSPFFQAVQRLYSEGIINGFGDNTYRPNQPITRAELLKIILGTTGCSSCVQPTPEDVTKYDPVVNDPDLTAFNGLVDDTSSLAFDLSSVAFDAIFHYPDVALGDWFYYCVEIATDMGIVHGYKGDDDLGNNATGLFLPGNNISRAEATKVFLEAAEFTIYSSDEIYDETDEQGSDISGGWFYGPELNYIYSGVQYGLLEPDSQGRVFPERKITRGEMAVMAFKVLSQLQQNHAQEDFDNDGIENIEDSCICLAEDRDLLEDEDGCPESPVPVLEIPAVAEVPRVSGAYLVKGEQLCQFIEPLSEVVDGDEFYAVISDFNNQKVWRESNRLLYTSDE